MKNNINMLFLTDINVSNVHLMLAKIIDKFSQYNIKFLNSRVPKNFYDDSKWYGVMGDRFDISLSLKDMMWITKFSKILNTICKSDVVFCTGVVANFAWLCRKPYIYFCTGSDLDQYSKYGCSVFEYINWSSNLLRRISRPIKKVLYRQAIKNANITVIAPYQLNAIKSLGYKKLAFFPHPLESEYLEVSLENREKYISNLKLQYDCEWIFFSSTRHTWSEELFGENDYKGNDIVIKAFYEFLKNPENAGGKLFLVEKGQDVEKSKSLIFNLGITQRVVWLKPMNRKRLMEFYCGAHVCFDQFSRGCLALCAIESMACGAPTVSYIGQVTSEVPFYNALPPIFNSNNSIEIAEFLNKMLHDEKSRKEIEVNSYNWVRQNCSYEMIANAFIKMVNDLKNFNE